MQACVIFLPSCPRAQGDCASPELSRAIGIKVSLTGTPQGQRETAACFGANRWRRRWRLQMGHAAQWWWKWWSLASSSVMRAPSPLCSFIRGRQWNKERVGFWQSNILILNFLQSEGFFAPFHEIIRICQFLILSYSFTFYCYKTMTLESPSVKR